MKNKYLLCIVLNILFIILGTCLWMFIIMGVEFSPNIGEPISYAICATLIVAILIWWQYRIFRHHTRMVLFLLDALENEDHTIHFCETEGSEENRLIHKALNRVAKVLQQAQAEAIQQEKYYELILDCINTGIVVLNEQGAVVQSNKEALRLLGLKTFTHVKQLAQIDEKLMNCLQECQQGDNIHHLCNSKQSVANLSIRVSWIRVKKEMLRIVALSDIHNELNEKEVESWIKLTRVLTHEIMNSITPITSLSDTLLKLSTSDTTPEEIRNGLQTIHTTGRGLLSFVDSYREFTRIPTPKPSLFYVKPFIEGIQHLLYRPYSGKNISFKLFIEPEELILHADEQLIRQVMTNLLKNAIQAIEEGEQTEGEIKIHAYCDEYENVIIDISNNGANISPEIAEHIFIPFFSTKESGNGIGLSISQQIMRLSGGSITLLPGTATTFRLTFK